MRYANGNKERLKSENDKSERHSTRELGEV
jgi:hypothetical protein